MSIANLNVLLLQCSQFPHYIFCVPFKSDTEDISLSVCPVGSIPLLLLPFETRGEGVKAVSSISSRACILQITIFVSGAKPVGYGFS